MELDKRIIDIKKVMDCFTTKEAKQYLNTKGYFAYNLNDFTDLTTCYEGTLVGICHDIPEPYFNKNNELYFNFFLPERFIKEEEKKYRPYTLEEFLRVFIIGQPIKFRCKETKLDKLLIFNGYKKLSDVKVIVHISGYDFTLEELFDEYEWQRSNSEEYIPFGVEIEE